MARKVLVIGGGLMGITSAWYLAERGFDVTVLERREGSALETSFANGGLVTPSQSDPWNAPGTLRQLLKYLGREDSPLLLRPRALPGMLGWGLRFLRASRAAPWRRAAEANLRLGLYSVRTLQELRRQLPLQYDSLSAGTLKVFRDRKSLENSVALAESLAPLGLKYRRLSPADAGELEPLLQPLVRELSGAIHYPEDESGDAYLFTRQLEQHSLKAGVRFLYGVAARSLSRRGDRIAAVITTRGEMTADMFLLAAASVSTTLVAPLGLRLPVYPVKGYSATINGNWTRRLGLPLVDFGRKFVITPLGSRLRIAGTAEFNGFDTRANPQRSRNLVKRGLELVPELAQQLGSADIQHWTGLRPMSCDGPPVLGDSPFRNLFFNTGHGPLGWTLAAGSSRLVADRMAGQDPGITLTGLDYARFKA
jgi:D-amino-acid dehydrogenase